MSTPKRRLPVEAQYRKAANAKAYLRQQLAAALVERETLKSDLAAAHQKVRDLEAELGYTRREASAVKAMLLPGVRK